MKKWQKWHKKCVDCGTTTRPYYAKGKCLACYSRKRFATNTEYRENHKKAVYAWRDRHPERWDEIQKKANKKAWNKKKLLRRLEQNYD